METGDALILARYEAKQRVRECREELAEAMGEALYWETDYPDIDGTHVTRHGHHPIPKSREAFEHRCEGCDAETVAEWKPLFNDCIAAQRAANLAGQALYRRWLKLKKEQPNPPTTPDPQAQ